MAECDDKFWWLEAKAKTRGRYYREPVTSMGALDADRVQPGDLSLTTLSLDTFRKEIFVFEINLGAGSLLAESHKKFVTGFILFPHLPGDTGEEVLGEREEVLVGEVEQLPDERLGGGERACIGSLAVVLS